jgi:hypothetical protein
MALTINQYLIKLQELENPDLPKQKFCESVEKICDLAWDYFNKGGVAKDDEFRSYLLLKYYHTEDVSVIAKILQHEGKLRGELITTAYRQVKPLSPRDHGDEAVCTMFRSIDDDGGFSRETRLKIVRNVIKQYHHAHVDKYVKIHDKPCTIM